MFIHLFKQKELPFFETDGKERQEAIEKLLSQGTMRSGYYLLLLIATCIVVPGLFLNNMSVVIGGMILAPLLVPILSLALAIISLNGNVIIRSFYLLVLSVLLVIATSMILTYGLLHVADRTPDFSLKIQPLIYLFIAFCSGIAAAFAWVKENLSPTIAGIATAVALLPPLCQIGIGLVLRNNAYAYESLRLFLANVIGIIIAACIVFLVLGFFSTAPIQDKALEKNGD